MVQTCPNNSDERLIKFLNKARGSRDIKGGGQISPGAWRKCERLSLDKGVGIQMGDGIMCLHALLSLGQLQDTTFPR